MPRYIDADRLIKGIRQDVCSTCAVDDECVCDYEECIIYIEDCPTADVQEVKHGRWEDNYVGDSIEGLYCTECGKICGCEFDYCPNCGAKMDEEAKTDET